MSAHYIISTEGVNKDGVVQGLEWLLDTAEVRKSPALIAVESVQSLKNIFGDKDAVKLRQDKYLLSSKVRVSIAFFSRFPGHFDGPIFAIYPSDRLLTKVDCIREATDILVLPWGKAETTDWCLAWNPAELGDPLNKGQVFELDPIVEIALSSFASVINQSTGISHPSDKARAVNTFRALVSHRIAYDPDEIRAWLVGNRRMHADDADDVRRIAKHIKEGKRVTGGGPASTYNKLYESWVSRLK